MNKETLLGALCLSLAASIWGGMYVISKYVLDYVPPLTLVWLRFVIAFVVLFSIMKVKHRKANKQKLTNREWLLLIWIGFIGYFVSITCQFVGTKLSDAHTGALITSATPAFIVLFAKFILKEALTVKKLLSLVLATTGVFIVVGLDTHMGSYFWGSLILLGAAVTWALLSVYVKVASSTLSSLFITSYGIGFAVLFITPFMIWEVQTQEVVVNNTLIVIGILYLGIVSTAGAFFLWNQGMKYIDAGVGSLFFFFQPIVGGILGWAVLGEQLSVTFFVGGLLILSGVMIAGYTRKR